jgi:hypothetical protein
VISDNNQPLEPQATSAMKISVLVLVLTTFGSMASVAAAQAVRATVGSGQHYLTAACGSAPDRAWVTWPTLTMIHGSTPLWSSLPVEKLALIRNDGQWVSETVTATQVTTVGHGQSTYTSSLTSAGIVTTREVGTFIQHGVSASVVSTETLNLNTGEYQWCREITWPPFEPDNQYRRATLPVTLTPTVLSVDLAIVNFAPPQLLKKGPNTVAATALVRNVGQLTTTPAVLDFEIQDPRTSSWRNLGSRVVQSLLPGQAEPLPANADSLTAPDDFPISIYRQEASGETGTYAFRACVRPLTSETNTANNCVTTPTRAVTMNSACHVPGLVRIPDTETDALELERTRRNRRPPDRFVSPPLLNADLARRIDTFINRVEFFLCPLGSCGLYRESGYRPEPYTAHLHGGSEALKAIGFQPSAECVDYREALSTHFNGEHRILSSGRHAGLMLNRPGTSNHDSQPAAAVDLGGLMTLPGVSPRSRSVIDDIARNVGLHRPCWKPRLDYVHFELLTTNCSRANVTARRPASPDTADRVADTGMPIHVLVTDPEGRRIGFDPATGTWVNELGDRASYTATSDLEEIIIDGAPEGEYVVTGVGAGGGSYTVTTSVEELEGDVLGTETVNGVATAGAPIERITLPVVEQMPQPPGLDVALNHGGFTRGDTMIVAGSLTPFAAPRQVDAYVVVRLPSGQFLSLQLGGALVPGIVPIAQRFVPFQFDGSLAQYTFTGVEPLGTYTWYSVLTEPGTLNFVSPLEQVSFTVVR